MRIEKAWGYEVVLVNEPEYCAKILHIAPGKQCSYHYHRVKKETFIVESGKVYLEHELFAGSLKPGESRTIQPGDRHRFSSDRGATILEISTHHSDEDVVRLEPSGDMNNAPFCYPVYRYDSIFAPDFKVDAKITHLPATNPRDEGGAQSGPNVCNRP